MALDPRIQCWWEEGIWPVSRKDEPDSRNFEDVRKRVWLLGWPGAGWHDLSVMHGTYDDPDYVPYDSTHWTGLWTGYEEPNHAEPGEVIVLYKDAGDVVDLYTNRIVMDDDDLDANPPIQAGVIDGVHWRLYPNPNLYAHWNQNAGKPLIEGDGRWLFIYHGAYSPSPPCDPAVTEYVCESRARNWLPRQLNPYRQIAPTKEGAVVTQRHSPVEQARSNITGSLGTAWDRSTLAEEECTRPARQTEYILDGGEPEITCTEASEESNQCAADPKINDAYQAYVIAAIERASHYVKPVDAAWKATWLAFQPKTLWADDTPYAYKDIVYLVTEEDEVMYICYLPHTSDTGDNKPGSGTNWADYWMTPPYSPEFFYYQPVYAHLGGDNVTDTSLSYSWFWGCNDSAFELCLRELGKTESVYPAWSATHGVYLVGDVAKTGDVCKQCKMEHTAAGDKALDNDTYWEDVTEYDWWWDTGHPAVPWWLYKARMNNRDEYGEEIVEGDWPEPRGCWRRTWRHSAGRVGGVGGLMWPGEKGDPPGYDPMKFIITQTVYNLIPEAHQKYYAVVAVEALHAAAYGEDEEARIAARHDPVHIRHVEFEETNYPHPIYEMHDIVNHLRNVLLQLHLMDDNGVQAPLDVLRHKGLSSGNANSLTAYANARINGELPENMDWYTLDEAEPSPGFGGGMGYNVDIDFNGPPLEYRATTTRTPCRLEIYKTGEMLASLNLPYILYRLAYQGIAAPGDPDKTEADGCTFGFGDKTFCAEPEISWKVTYVRIEFATGESWIDKETTPWTEVHRFYLNILDEWPAMDVDGHLDFEGAYYGDYRRWWRETSICRLGYLANLPIVFETDWDKVVSTVFDEDLSNAIIL